MDVIKPLLGMAKHSVALLLVLLLVACSREPVAPLRLGSNPWPGYEPLYLARDLGYVDERQVRIFELPTANLAVESFRNHSSDVASVTLDEAIGMLHDGTRLRILLVLDSSHGADAVVARPEIRQLSDLKGKRIAITNIPLNMYILTRMLDAAGLSRQDVTVVPMPETRHAQYYREGAADAVITFSPFMAELLKDGAHVIFDSSKIPDEIFDVLVVHEDVYQTRRAELCNFVKQWYRTLDYMQSAPEDARRRISSRLGIDVADYPSAMAGIVIPGRADSEHLLGGAEPRVIAQAQRLMQVMLNEGLLEHPVDVSSMVDPGFQECLTP